MPVERVTGGISLAAGNASISWHSTRGRPSSVVGFRTDEATTPLDQMMTALREGRPTPQLVTLPDGATYLQVAALLDITDIHSSCHLSGTVRRRRYLSIRRT